MTTRHETRLIPRRGNPLGTRWKVRCDTCRFDIHTGELAYDAAKAVAHEHAGGDGK